MIALPPRNGTTINGTSASVTGSDNLWYRYFNRSVIKGTKTTFFVSRIEHQAEPGCYYRYFNSYIKTFFSITYPTIY